MSLEPGRDGDDLDGAPDPAAVSGADAGVCGDVAPGQPLARGVQRRLVGLDGEHVVPRGRRRSPSRCQSGSASRPWSHATGQVEAGQKRSYRGDLVALGRGGPLAPARLRWRGRMPTPGVGPPWWRCGRRGWSSRRSRSPGVRRPPRRGSTGTLRPSGPGWPRRGGRDLAERRVVWCGRPRHPSSTSCAPVSSLAHCPIAAKERAPATAAANATETIPSRACRIFNTWTRLAALGSCPTRHGIGEDDIDCSASTPRRRA